MLSAAAAAAAWVLVGHCVHANTPCHRAMSVARVFGFDNNRYRAVRAVEGKYGAGASACRGDGVGRGRERAGARARVSTVCDVY